MINHDIMGLHISVHNSHAVAIIQGLWEEKVRKERVSMYKSVFLVKVLYFFLHSFPSSLIRPMAIKVRTITHIAIL